MFLEVFLPFDLYYLSTLKGFGEKNCPPWWLRYSMALLETSRSVEAIAYLQRTLNRYPDIDECNAFGAALYTALNNPVEATTYWNHIVDTDKTKYLSDEYIVKTLRWGPVAVKSMKTFLQRLPA